VSPNGDIDKKKWRDRAFAAGVNREEIEEGTADLGVELWEHVGVVLAAMQEHAAELGLDGKLAHQAGQSGGQGFV
jgi:predicted hydrolase (HD superfamily)